MFVKDALYLLCLVRMFVKDALYLLCLVRMFVKDALYLLCLVRMFVKDAYAFYSYAVFVFYCIVYNYNNRGSRRNSPRIYNLVIQNNMLNNTHTK